MAPHANVIHHDLDLRFQHQEFVNVKISIYQRISQTAIDSRKIPMDPHSGVRDTMQVYHFFPPKLRFLFHLF